MGRCYLVIAALLLTISTKAQELEYKMEVGGMAGMCFYMGDANLNGWYKDITPAAAVIARYNINPRLALKGNVGWSKIKGSLDSNSNIYPEKEGMNRVFSNTLVDVGCQMEANFFGYGTGGGYKGHKRLTPYIQGGLSFTYCGNTLTMSVPVGIGVKYKVRERVNVGIDWTMRFAMSDKIDGVYDPYKIESGFMKNKDSYSWTMVFLTYDMFPKYRKCNND